METFAQILGVVVAAICIVAAQMKHKWQMLLCSTVANILNGLSFFFLGGAISGAIPCWIAVFQTLLVAYKVYYDKPITVIEKSIFLVIYVAVGVISIKTAVDVLPLIGSVLFVVGTFFRKEQPTRVISAFNNSVWIVYTAIIGSTSIIAQILSLVSNLIGLYRYRKKPKIEGDML